jgi:hypothetical protein
VAQSVFRAYKIGYLTIIEEQGRDDPGCPNGRCEKNT